MKLTLLVIACLLYSTHASLTFYHPDIDEFPYEFGDDSYFTQTVKPERFLDDSEKAIMFIFLTAVAGFGAIALFMASYHCCYARHERGGQGFTIYAIFFTAYLFGGFTQLQQDATAHADGINTSMAITECLYLLFLLAGFLLMFVDKFPEYAKRVEGCPCDHEIKHQGRALGSGKRARAMFENSRYNCCFPCTFTGLISWIAVLGLIGVFVSIVLGYQWPFKSPVEARSFIVTATFLICVLTILIMLFKTIHVCWRKKKNKTMDSDETSQSTNEIPDTSIAGVQVNDIDSKSAMYTPSQDNEAKTKLRDSFPNPNHMSDGMINSDENKRLRRRQLDCCYICRCCANRYFKRWILEGKAFQYLRLGILYKPEQFFSFLGIVAVLYQAIVLFTIPFDVRYTTLFQTSRFMMIFVFGISMLVDIGIWVDGFMDYVELYANGYEMDADIPNAADENAENDRHESRTLTNLPVSNTNHSRSESTKFEIGDEPAPLDKPEDPYEETEVVITEIERPSSLPSPKTKTDQPVPYQFVLENKKKKVNTISKSDSPVNVVKVESVNKDEFDSIATRAPSVNSEPSKAVEQPKTVEPKTIDTKPSNEPTELDGDTELTAGESTILALAKELDTDYKELNP